MAEPTPDQYSARHLSVLDGLEAVRKRPGMYIGTTDSRGLMHCLWEVIDNSVDEALSGHGSRIEVRLGADNSVTVNDAGRGIPVDIEPKTGLTGVEVVFTKLHAGGKFGASNYGAAGGLHGVGASVVNALSERLDVEVTRAGKVYAMSFHRGEPGTFDDGAGDARPDAPFTPFTSGSELRVVGKAARGKTGTRVRYWADPQIFIKGAEFQPDDLAARARQTAFLVPGLEMTIEDARDASTEPIVSSFRYEGGIAEFAEYLAPDSPTTDVWRIEGEGTYKETVPVLDAAGHMVSQEVHRTAAVDLALRWGAGYDTTVRSFVNIIATPKGGTHLAGFEQSLLKFVRAEVERNARKLKVGASEKLEKDDVMAGLTAVVTVRIPEPQFEGQTKEVLGTPPIRQIVSTVLANGLKERFASTKRQDKTEASLLLDKV
ncbi:MAG: ATP-binding protein, partial [Pseudoclavibacter sp.]